MKAAVPSLSTCERQKWIGAEGWYSPFMSRLLANGSSGKWQRGNISVAVMVRSRVLVPEMSIGR